MLGLTVVTHTVPSWNRDTSRCINSINAALLENMDHRIITHDGNSKTFLQSRYDSMALNDIVVFVDDDDYISEDSLRLCQIALSTNDVGIAFTQQIMIAPDGRRFSSDCPQSIKDIAIDPDKIHHMVAYRTKYVTERSLALSLLHNAGIEWIMTADAASRAGAFFVPEYGYYWDHTNSYNQDHRNPERQAAFKKGKDQISIELRSWFNDSLEISTW